MGYFILEGKCVNYFIGQSNILKGNVPKNEKKGLTDIKCAELNFLFLFLFFSKKFKKKYINNLTRKPIFKTQTLKSSYCMPQKIGNA